MHQHRWYMFWDFCGAHTFLCKCGEAMSDGTAESRVNAVEAFPLQQALQVLADLEHASGVFVGDEYEALQRYVAELDQ